MINLDSLVYAKLETIAPTYQGYPTKWNELPVISYACEQNSSAIKAAEEILARDNNQPVFGIR